MVVDGVKTAKRRQQIPCRLLSHAGDTGDIVGGITHKGLTVHQTDGVKAVLLPEGLRRIASGKGLARFAGHQPHGHMVIHQLQAVPVTGENDAFPAGLGADSSHGAQNIVGFPSLLFIDGNGHGP